jgi:hypothetical protein
MADRKKTPDILGSLLGDTSMPEYHNTGIPEYHKDSKPELQPTSKPVSKPTGKPVSQKKPEAQEPAEKVKATYYLDAEVVEALEEGWMELRRLADKKDRGRISKSLIVELSLQLALDELKTKGVNSLLAKKV